MGGKGVPAFFTKAGLGTLVETGGWAILKDPSNPEKPKIVSKPK